MPFPRQKLTGDLRRLGLEPGQTVMLHASVCAVGPVYGGPDEIHLAVGEAIAPGGTLTMYIGCQAGYDDIGRNIYTADEEAALLEHMPPFDFQHARAARDFGILAEFFRSYPGTVCSCNVGARMAARGARADWLMAGQLWDYAYGCGSPFDKLCQPGGKVLLLGSDHGEVTLLHYAEHIAPFANKSVAKYKAPVLERGRRVWRDCEEFDSSGCGVHANWPAEAFKIIVDGFIAANAGTAACRCGRVGTADSVLLDAARLVDYAVPVMLAWAEGCA